MLTKHAAKWELASDNGKQHKRRNEPWKEHIERLSSATKAGPKENSEQIQNDEDDDANQAQAERC